MMVKNKSGEAAGSFICNLLFILLSAACIIPVILIVSISLSDNGEILKNGYSLIPRGFTFEAYRQVDMDKILNAYGITIYSTVVGTILSMACTVLLAYVASRDDYKYKTIISFLIFFTMLFQAGLVPTYIWIVDYLGWKNNLLVLVAPSLVQAWNIILMRSFFYGIPKGITEAATIDGCSEMKLLTKIVIPLSMPALATVGLFTMLGYFNDWQLSMLYMDDSTKYSLQYFLYKTINNIKEMQNSNMLEATDVIPLESVRMAMAVISILPIIVVFPFLQKYFVKGITLGSVKG